MAEHWEFSLRDTPNATFMRMKEDRGFSPQSTESSGQPPRYCSTKADAQKKQDGKTTHFSVLLSF